MLSISIQRNKHLQGKETRDKKDERTMTLKEIQKNLLKTERTVAMDQELKEIMKYNDFNEYDQAIRRANARKPKKPLKIHGNNFDLITSEKDQVNISKFFQKLFSSKVTIMLIPSKKMDPPFTPDESRKHQENLKTTKLSNQMEFTQNILGKELANYSLISLIKQVRLEIIRRISDQEF